MRYLTSGLVVLVLGLALVQAAPKKIEKKSISDAGAPKAIEQVSQNLDAPAKLGDEALLEATDGQNVERAKKQATTFCVEVRPNKPSQVDCSELNNNQPQRPPPQPQPEPEPQPHPENYRPSEIKIDFLQPPVPMGPPCEPEIAGFIAPGGDVVYAPTGNCAHNIPSTSQTPYYGQSPMMPSGPGGHVHVLHIPGGFPHSGFPGNYPSTGLPGSYPAGMIPNSGAGFPNSGAGFPNSGAGFPNSGAGFPNIQISTGPSGPGSFPMNGLSNGGLPNGAGVPSINIIPGSGFPSGMPSSGSPYGGGGVPTINILPGTGLPGGLPNGAYPSGGSPTGGYPSGVSPIHVLHLPSGGIPSGPSTGGNGYPTIYITPGSGTPGASPQGPHLPAPHPGHTHGHHHTPLHLNGVQCTCKSSLGTNLYRSSDGGMPSSEQLAAQFLEDLSKNTQQQPGSQVMSKASSPDNGWGIAKSSSPDNGWGIAKSSSPDNGWGIAKSSSPDNGWGVAKSSSPDNGWGIAKSSSPDNGWGIAKTSSPDNGWGIAKASSPDNGWGIAKASSPDNGWGVSNGPVNTGKSAGTDSRYMPMRPMAQSQVMYQQQSTASMAPGMHGMHGMPMSGYGMGPMMTPGMSMGMPMRSNNQYDDSFQSGYPMQGLRLSRGPDEADAKAAEKGEGPKPETEEEAAKKGSVSEIMDKMMKKTQEDEIETKNTRLARFLMGEKDAKSNLLDDE